MPVFVLGIDIIKAIIWHRAKAIHVALVPFRAPFIP